MKWSRYNKIFRSSKYGWLIYNSASNTFAEIDDDTYPEIMKISQNPDNYDFSINPGLYFQLRTNGLLVENNGDDDYINILKMTRLQNNYSDGHLLLTIAPTRECNFNCIYCYEENRAPVHMSEDVEKKIGDIVSKNRDLKSLHVCWYGGEPLLRFNTICSLTKRFLENNINYSAMIVTNGYLLDDKKIAQFSDLKIKTAQLTIDGPEHIHNCRRPLKNGGGTYQRIVENLERLLEGWNGTVQLRVNIDGESKKYYHEIHREIFNKLDKYHDRLIVYPGIVHDDGSHPDITCLMDKEEEAKFTIEQYEKHGINDLRAFPGRSYIGCTALRKNAFVIGPEGEMYKCWNDIGVQERIIGSVMDRTIGNKNVIANYMVGANYLDDPECLKCFYFPVCDGGCAWMRLENNISGVKRYEVCLKFKNNIESLLELYYDKKIKQDLKINKPIAAEMEVAG